MIYLASDHAGFNMKKEIIKRLNSTKISYTDLGCNSIESVDYPNFANNLCQKIKDGDIGIIICGTGIGVSIASNRHNHIRCALCHDNYTAKAARQHNNANVLALGARLSKYKDIEEIVEIWLKTPFEGGRHLKRINMIEINE